VFKTDKHSQINEHTQCRRIPEIVNQRSNGGRARRGSDDERAGKVGCRRRLGGGGTAPNIAVGIVSIGLVECRFVVVVELHSAASTRRDGDSRARHAKARARIGSVTRSCTRSCGRVGRRSDAAPRVSAHRRGGDDLVSGMRGLLLLLRLLARRRRVRQVGRGQHGPRRHGKRSARALMLDRRLASFQHESRNKQHLND
jgi:hypothetical protein